MLAGMIDAYFVAPQLKLPITQVLYTDTSLLAGAFSVIAMAIGVVFIALVFFPVINTKSQIIALTYLVFRVIECLLLLIGPISYFYIIYLGQGIIGDHNMDNYFTAATLAIRLKFICYQTAMIFLGIGSLFLCYFLYKSRYVPRLIAFWGGIGYFLLLLSAILDLCGLIDTTTISGALFYIPGGLWEFVALPLWLLIKGFNTKAQHSIEKE